MAGFQFGPDGHRDEAGGEGSEVAQNKDGFVGTPRRASACGAAR